MSKRLAGTPPYVPLEVWKGELPMDKYVDAYAAAAVLYEMVEGHVMNKDFMADPRPRPKLALVAKWNHENGFLQRLFEILHDKPEKMNSNWHGWRAFKRATAFLLVVDYATGVKETSCPVPLAAVCLSCFFSFLRLRLFGRTINFLTS